MNTILVIEDDDLTRENLRIILEMEGFAVRATPDGLTGLQEARQRVPDLILCDVTMPRLDGYGVLNALRSNPDTRAIPFIFFTARGERDQLRAGMNLGADDYLCKPVESDELLAAIRVRLRRHREQIEAGLGPVQITPDFRSAQPLEGLGLTPREAEVLLWVAQGKANCDVATILGMSEKTVKIHLGHIFEKLSVESRTAAALCAVEALSGRLPKPL